MSCFVTFLNTLIMMHAFTHASVASVIHAYDKLISSEAKQKYLWWASKTLATGQTAGLQDWTWEMDPTQQTPAAPAFNNEGELGKTWRRPLQQSFEFQANSSLCSAWVCITLKQFVPPYSVHCLMLNDNKLRNCKIYYIVFIDSYMYALCRRMG